MQGFNKETVKDPSREIFAEHPELKDELQNVLGNYKVDEISHEANKANLDSKNSIIKENIDPQKSKEDDFKLDFNRYKKELSDSFNDFKQNIYKQIKLAKNSAYENIQKEKDKLEVTQKNLEDSLEKATLEYHSKVQAQREKLWDKDEGNDPGNDKRKLVSEENKEVARIKSLIKDGEMSEKMLKVVQNIPGITPQSYTRLCDILHYHCPPETTPPTLAPTEMAEPSSGGEGSGSGEEGEGEGGSGKVSEEEEEDPRQKKLNAFKQKLYEKDKKLILSHAEKNQEMEKQYEDKLAYEKEKIAKAEAQKKVEDDEYLEALKKQQERDREQRIKDQDEELQELRQRNENALNEERVKLYGHWKPRNGGKVESVIEYKPNEATPAEATPEPTGQSTASVFNPSSSEQSELKANNANAKMEQEILQTTLKVTKNGHIRLKKLN